MPAWAKSAIWPSDVLRVIMRNVLAARHRQDFFVRKFSPVMAELKKQRVLNYGPNDLHIHHTMVNIWIARRNVAYRPGKYGTFAPGNGRPRVR